MISRATVLRPWRQAVLAAVTVLTLSSCGNMFQSMVAKYGPTTDQKGSQELQKLADHGRELLAKGEYVQAINESPGVWKALSTSDSRKGGIATLYFREFCDALYATEKTLPAFLVSSLFQMAVESFPAKTWKEDFVAGDRDHLKAGAKAAAARARPELEGFAGAAAKRGHKATEFMYLAQVLRTNPTDEGAKAQSDASLQRLRAEYRATFAVRGNDELAKQVIGGQDRPLERDSAKPHLNAELTLAAPVYDTSSTKVTVRAKVIRGKREEVNSRYKDAEEQAVFHEKRCDSLQKSINAGTNVPSNSKAQADHRKQAQQWRAKLAKLTPTIQVDNVVEVGFPGVEHTLSGSLAVTGKITVVPLKDAVPLSNSVSAQAVVLEHEGLAEAKLGPQHPTLPPAGSLNGQLMTSMVAAVSAALAEAYDRRVKALVAPMEQGEDAQKVEAAAVVLLLTRAGQPGPYATLIQQTTRLPDVLKLLQH